MKAQQYQYQNQVQILYQKHLKFQIPYRSSGCPTIYLAYNNTYILHTYNIQHITNQGKLLKQLTLQGVSNVYGKWMIKQNIFVLWVKTNQDKDHEIWQWNLQDNSCVKLKIKRILSEESIVNVLAFQDSALMCVIQSIQTSEMTSKQNLQYYQFPLKNQEQNTIYSSIFDMNDWSRMKTPKKLNRHSGIVWVQEQLDFETSSTFWIFDLRNTGEKKQRINFYSFRQVMNENAQIFDIQLKDIWEPEQGKIYLKYFMNLSYHKYNRSSKQKPPGQAYKSIEGVYQVIWNYQQNTHYVPKFASRQQHAIQFLGNLRNIKNFYIWYKGYRQPMMRMAQKSLRMSVYYVDFKSEQIMGSELASDYEYTPNEVSSIYNFSYPEYSNDLILESVKLDPKELHPIIKVSITKIELLPYSGKIITAFLISQIVQNCDEDLLDQVANLIQFKHGLDGYSPKKKVIQPMIIRKQNEH